MPVVDDLEESDDGATWGTEEEYEKKERLLQEICSLAKDFGYKIKAVKRSPLRVKGKMEIRERQLQAQLNKASQREQLSRFHKATQDAMLKIEETICDKLAK
ncbi:hypothetical protein MRX96_029366 [Rhipicephalus microplus]